jgi:hypothetical protein
MDSKQGYPNGNGAAPLSSMDTKGQPQQQFAPPADPFVDNKRQSQQYAAPSQAPPPPSQAYATPSNAAPPPPPPAYIKDVSMNDTANYNSDKDLLAACRAKGISPYFATQITRLREYSSIRLVLDDSGSL